MDKYNRRHMELSKMYNKSLEEGRYADSISCLDEMIIIAEEENRPNDMERLKVVRNSIEQMISMPRLYNISCGNNNGNARTLTQEPQQLANDA